MPPFSNQQCMAVAVNNFTLVKSIEQHMFALVGGLDATILLHPTVAVTKV